MQKNSVTTEVFAEEVNIVSTSMDNCMEIVVFTTGGTIGMRRHEEGVAPGENLSALLSELSSVRNVQVRVVQWSNKPSPHITPADMLRLAHDVDTALAASSVCGCVVLHGTDLLAETSFFLDLVITSIKPVVTTGSMRHTEEAGYDGQRNVLNSILACLAMPDSSEVLVQIADLLFTARDAMKLDSVSVDPFIGQQRGNVGRIAGETVDILQDVWVQRPRLPFPVTGLSVSVPLVGCFPGMARHEFEAIACRPEAPVAGLVLEGFGAGNVPPDIVPSLQALIAMGIPVVLTTRCLRGGVVPLYGYEGGGAALMEMGVISAGNLSGMKAQLLLKAALGSGYPVEQVAALFTKRK